MAAVSFNNTNISELIAKGGNLDVQDKNGDTPLHYAVKIGSLPLVDSLLKHGANIDSRNTNGNTALHEAVSKKNLTLVKKLLLSGCNVNLQNELRYTPLHIAVDQHLDSIVEILMEVAVDMNLRDYRGLTALDLAVDINASVTVISTLLDQVININCFGETPIFSAVCHESNELVTKMLLDRGFKANIRDYRGLTPLHILKDHTKKRTVELLLDNGLDIDVKDANGWTPLFYAIKCQNTSVVEILLNEGCDVNSQDIMGKSPLHIACMEHDIGLVGRLLLEKSLNIDQKDEHGQTALLQAVRENNVPVVDLLLLKGSCISAQDSKGNSPFHIASKYCLLESLKRLLCEKTYDLNQKDVNGNTPLFLAAENNHEDVIKLLLKNRAGLNVQNRVGQTPLHVAAHYENSNSVQLLLEAGAKLDIMDNRGKTPLDLSIKISDPVHQRNSITNLLKEHIIKIKSANLELRLITENYDFIGYEPFKESCLKEVEKMKTKKFGGVSMFRIISDAGSQNPVFAGNLEMGHFIKSGCLESEFPLYSSLLKSSFNEEKERNSLLSSTPFDIRVNEGGFSRKLPNELKRKIFCHLTNEELENVKKACL